MATGDYSLVNPQGVPQWQVEYSMPWIPMLGINFHLAIDGLSLLMVVLTAIMGLSQSSVRGVKTKPTKVLITLTCCGLLQV